MWVGQAVNKNGISKLEDSVGTTEVRKDKFVSRLVPKGALKEIQQVARSIRKYNDTYTLPWASNGVRIMQADRLFEHTQKLNELRQEFNNAVDRFLARYDEYFQWAQLSDPLFNKDLYPSKNNLRSKFDVHVDLLPFPAVADFRLENMNEQIREMAASTIDKRTREASHSVLRQLLAALETLDPDDPVRSY